MTGCAWSSPPIPTYRSGPATCLPDLWAAIDAADVVVHAGDWVDESLLDRISSAGTRLIGVYGNNDGPALRARLPEVARAN